MSFFRRKGKIPAGWRYNSPVRRERLKFSQPTEKEENKPAMSEYETETPPNSASPNVKACWAIRKALREAPEGMTTRQLIDSVRKFWPDDGDFEGKRGEHRIRGARIFLSRGGAIEKVEAEHA